MKRSQDLLRNRAHDILNVDLSNNEKKSHKNMHNLIDELLLHQIELDLQNLNLIELQAELEESRSKYLNLYEHAPIGYFILNAKGLIVEANPVGADVLGLKRDKLINRSFSRYVAPESHYIFSGFMQRILKETNQHHCEIKLLRRDGPLMFVRIEGKLLKNAQTAENKLLMMVTETSFNSNKDSASSQELATLIAYELKHPLSVISNYIHGCIRQLEGETRDNTNILKAMKVASTQLNRATELILRLKNFIKGNLDYQLTCIDTLIKESISLLEQEINDFPITISYSPNKSIPKILLDKMQIEQVILNLSRNAVEAMHDARTEDAKLTIRATQLSMRAVEIAVIDNGPGFCEKEIHKLFNPNYTTKSYGIGIGLSICRSIVESHGGELSAEVNLTYGSTFKFTLPLKEHT